ncbi:hypothetical protein ABIE21_000724 [Conyzicola nivalis]|uniref:Uncharacterized protein n=1 Tax=Conyzicola nivalis TaxID=1477021 RepID=A0ABV2QJL8_9MICO
MCIADPQVQLGPVDQRTYAIDPHRIRMPQQTGVEHGDGRRVVAVGVTLPCRILDDAREPALGVGGLRVTSMLPYESSGTKPSTPWS